MRPLLAVVLLASCTFNVAVRTASHEASTADALSGVRSDLGAAGLRDGLVRVTGAARVGARATVSVGSLVSGEGGAAAGADVRWAPAVAGIAALSVVRRAPETSWLDEVAIEVPTSTGVELDVAGADVSVTGTAGRVVVRAGSGAIDVSGAADVELETDGGAITASAASGTVTSGAGAIVLDVTGEIVARTAGGRISGTIGGGDLASANGALDLDLRGALAGDLLLASESGSIVLRVPPGASLVLDLEAEHGRVQIEAGGVSFTGSGAVTRTLGAGGPRVVCRTGAGSISILER